MNICFFIAVYKDQELAEKRLPLLRSFYPEADIICCCDGIEHLQLMALCESIQIHYFAGQRLKLNQFGGQWVQRMLKLFLEKSNADVLIKLDPDSKLLRRFHQIPTADLFGDPNFSGQYLHFNGGCLGLSRTACKQILESGLLLDSIYTKPWFAYQRYQSPYLQPNEDRSPEFLIGSDLILSDVASRLNLVIQAWDEVCCASLTEQLQHLLEGLSQAEVSQKYAVIHPCKHE